MFYKINMKSNKRELFYTKYLAKPFKIIKKVFLFNIYFIFKICK